LPTGKLEMKEPGRPRKLAGSNGDLNEIDLSRILQYASFRMLLFLLNNTKYALDNESKAA